MSSAKVILETHDSYDELAVTCYEEHSFIDKPRFGDYARLFHFNYGSKIILYGDGRAEAYDEYSKLELTKLFNIKKDDHLKFIEQILNETAVKLKVHERTKEALLKALDEIYREEGRT